MGSTITDIIDCEAHHCDITFIGFHNDADGWASAAQVIRFKKLYDNIKYSTDIRLFPLQHGSRNMRYEDRLMEQIRDCQDTTSDSSYRIILLDYCLQMNNMLELFSLADAGVGFTWIDHHEIDQAILADLCERRFMFDNSVPEHHSVWLDKNKAACIQTAEYLQLCSEWHGVDMRTITVENPVLEAIAKRDTGDYEFCDLTDAITSALFVNFHGYSFDHVSAQNLSSYADLLESNGFYLEQFGAPICAERRQRFNRDLNQSFSLTFSAEDGSWFKCAAVFSTGDLITPLATRLAQDTGCAACVITVTVNGLILGFRSTPDCQLTALECAKMLGGGGHVHAAAASISFNNLRQVDKKLYRISL